MPFVSGECSVGSKVNDNRNEVISILANHDKRMEAMRANILLMADISDSLWAEWEQKTSKVLIDLIKRK